MIAYESNITKQSVAFYDKLKDFYSNAKAEGFILGTFDETFKDNSSRIDFITNLIDLDMEGKLSSRMHMLLSENYEFFINFINGKDSEKPLVVPNSIMNKMTENREIPNEKNLFSQEELMYLLDIIERNYIMCQNNFANKTLYIKLPSESLHHDIYEVLEIREDNIAHLLGLTSETSSLTSFYVTLTHDDKPAQNIAKFFLSNEGKQILLNEYNKNVEFIKNFKSTDFNLFKSEFKKTFGYDYPLFELNKLLIKNISLFDYERLNFSEVIVDHIDDNINCDLYIPHYNGDFKSSSIKYTSQVKDVLDTYFLFSNLTKEKQSMVEVQFPEYKNFFANKNIIEALQKNLSYDFMEKFRITNQDLIKQIKNIKNYIISLSDYDLSLIGFGTKRMHSISNGKTLVFEKTCKTIITEKTPNILEKYLKDGRIYFIDVILSENGQVLKISNSNEELSFYERHLESTKYSALYEKLKTLNNKKLNYDLFLEENFGKTK